MDNKDAPDDPNRAFLTTFLAEQDIACPRCGYNLRGLTRGRCPECGDDLQLQIGLVEPRLAAYITLLVACSCAFGGSALIVLIALLEGSFAWLARPGGVVLLVECALSTILLPLVLGLRRRFRRAATSVQWLLAGLALTLFATLSTLFVSLVIV